MPTELTTLRVNGPGREEIVNGLSYADYDAEAGLRVSSVKSMAKSPLQFHWDWDHPRASSDAMCWGTAVHTLILEPGNFADEVACWYGADRRTKAGKSAWAEFQEESVGKIILKEDEYNGVLTAGRRASADPLIAPLMRSGNREVCGWTVEDGFQCKFRADWLTVEGQLVDVKTTRNIEPHKFSRNFFTFGYHIQLGLYSHWLKRLTGHEWPACVVAIENHPPYDCAVYPVADMILDMGRAAGLGLIGEIRDCLDRDEWPGVSRGNSVPIEVPQWVLESEELEL